MCDKGLIIKQIDKILGFLTPLLPLANSHMVDFFTENIFFKHLSNSMRNEIKNSNTTELIDRIFENNFNESSELNKFISTCHLLNLGNSHEICLDLQDCYKKLKRLGYEEVEGFRLEVFTKEKKSHEVEVLSAIVAALTQISKISHIVDIGSGKGYLSTMLAFHYNIPVLGIDSSVITTNGAASRSRKLKKVWKNLPVNPKKSLLKKEENCNTYDNDFYKQLTLFVDENLSIKDLVADVFSNSSENIGIVGLHTCGDLAGTSLKLFNNKKEVKFICNVGCCYHLMNEKYVDDSNFSLINDTFPMSSYLVKKGFKLGRNARMIAAQSVERILAHKELPNKAIFHRALLEVIVKRRKILLKNQVGKLKSKDNFTDYVLAAWKKLEIKEEISENEISEVIDEYENRATEINLFYLLRSMLSPVIESLILLDRFLFLQENKHTNSFLVRLFDPVISPRCYGLIALK